MTKSFLISVSVLFVANCASASVDTTPPPGGVYKLKPGIYVAEGSDCKDPPNAAILQYDGKGLSGAHTRTCKVTVRSRRKSSYTVDQSCIDAGEGPAPRSSERQLVTVRDALHFRQTVKGSGTNYAYCPIDQLPEGLRNNAR